MWFDDPDADEITEHGSRLRLGSTEDTDAAAKRG